MKRIGIVAVTAAAIGLVALSAASVAAAAGGPEYLACVKAAKVNKKPTGHYTKKECGEVSATNEGQYERATATKFPVKTTGKFGATTIYLYNPMEHKYESEVPCKTGTASGAITSATEGTIKLTYKGCNVPKEFADHEKAQFPGACSSPGKKTEEVVTETLATKLVWLDEAETVPGLLISPAPPGTTFGVVECTKGLVKARQYGSILAKLTPVGAVPKLLTAAINANTTTGEPEFGSYWQGATQTEVKLFTEIHAPNGIEKPAVPTSQISTIPLKDGKVLIG
jgi:hypothetical protein